MNYNYIFYAAKIESVIGSTCATINLDTQDLSRPSQGWETNKIECCLNDKVSSKNTLARSHKKRSFFLATLQDLARSCKILWYQDLQDLVRTCNAKFLHWKKS